MWLRSKSIQGLNSSILKVFDPKFGIFTQRQHPSYSRILDIILRICCKVNSLRSQFFCGLFFPQSYAATYSKEFAILTKLNEMKVLLILIFSLFHKKSQKLLICFFSLSISEFSIFDHKLYQQSIETVSICGFVKMQRPISRMEDSIIFFLLPN